MNEFGFGITLTIDNQDGQALLAKSIQETIDIIQSLTETGKIDIKLAWDCSQPIDSEVERLNLVRLLRVYEQMINDILLLRSFEINFVVDQEYYEENIELTEIPIESFIFHCHNFLD